VCRSVRRPAAGSGWLSKSACEDRAVSIRLLIADDQALVRGALAALLDLEPDLEVVAEVGRGDEVIDAAKNSQPDVALLDVEMPGLDGIEAAAALRTAVPGVRVLMVTTFGRPGYLRRAMQAGAAGFVVKDTPATQLADAVRRVHQGLRVVDPSLAAETLVAGTSPLTGREADVLRAAREGGTVADIAKELHLSEGTVRNHLSAAIGKTGARTRAEAARIAVDNGWL
jgi:two-component system response regulator DesR